MRTETGCVPSTLQLKSVDWSGVSESGKTAVTFPLYYFSPLSEAMTAARLKENIKIITMVATTKECFDILPPWNQGDRTLKGFTPVCFSLFMGRPVSLSRSN